MYGNKQQEMGLQFQYDIYKLLLNKKGLRDIKMSGWSDNYDISFHIERTKYLIECKIINLLVPERNGMRWSKVVLRRRQFRRLKDAESESKCKTEKIRCFYIVGMKLPTGYVYSVALPIKKAEALSKKCKSRKFRTINSRKLVREMPLDTWLENILMERKPQDFRS